MTTTAITSTTAAPEVPDFGQHLLKLAFINHRRYTICDDDGSVDDELDAFRALVRDALAAHGVDFDGSFQVARQRLGIAEPASYGHVRPDSVPLGIWDDDGDNAQALRTDTSGIQPPLTAAASDV